jgi:hypothetical protein
VCLEEWTKIKIRLGYVSVKTSHALYIMELVNLLEGVNVWTGIISSVDRLFVSIAA